MKGHLLFHQEQKVKYLVCDFFSLKKPKDLVKPFSQSPFLIITF